MTKKCNSTIAQPHYDEFASEFTEKDIQGVNSLQTPSPQGDHKKHCVKLNWWVDAVAGEDDIVDIYNKIDNRWKKPNHLIKCLFHAKLYV